MSSDKDVADTIRNLIPDIDELLDKFEPYLKESLSIAGEPETIVVAGLSKVLQDFYTGVENIFSLIAKKIDGSMPSGDSYHRDLLLQMAAPNEKRDWVISDGAKVKLTTYMAFRHKSRHMYSLHHEWDMMVPLVSDIDDTWALVRKDINKFADGL